MVENCNVYENGYVDGELVHVMDYVDGYVDGMDIFNFDEICLECFDEGMIEGYELCYVNSDLYNWGYDVGVVDVEGGTYNAGYDVGWGDGFSIGLSMIDEPTSLCYQVG